MYSISSLKNIFKFINYICLDDKVRYDFVFDSLYLPNLWTCITFRIENKIHFGKKNSLGNWIELWWNVHFSWIAISEKIQNFETSEEWTEMEINHSELSRKNPISIDQNIGSRTWYRGSNYTLHLNFVNNYTNTRYWRVKLTTLWTWFLWFGRRLFRTLSIWYSKIITGGISHLYLLNDSFM